MAAVTICSDFGAPKNKVWHCFHCLPIYFPWGNGIRCHNIIFLNVKLWANFFTLLFHFHQETGPISSWQIDGETMESVTDFIFLGSKITVDGVCSHKIKRHLLLGRKAMTNIDSILKSRDISLPTKVHLVKSMVFPVVMYGCESWTIKKAESQRIDASELWCWRRLLRVPWTSGRSNQSIL